MSLRGGFDGIARKLLRAALRGTAAAIESDPGADTAPYVLSPPGLGMAVRMALSGAYWIPEGYCRGDWNLVKGDLGDFVRHMMDSADARTMGGFTSQRRRMPSLRHVLKHWVLPKKFTREVRRHYDIDTKIYRLILDPEMVYTAAFFEEAPDLADAQQAKLARIVKRVGIADNSRVLNIGFGWASFERHLVRQTVTASVTGLTISSEQLDWAEHHNAESLTPEENSRIVLHLQDFRDHQPDQPYDAVVSVGLFEHVGRSLYGAFFRQCHDLVSADGRILVHTILKNRSNIPTNSWIDRHIFPGGYIASLAEITRAAEAAELDLVAVHLHGGVNYGNTCRAWRANLLRHRDEIMEIYTQDHGLSDAEARHAYRTWEIYLAGSEAGFLVKRRPMQTVQLVFRPTGHKGAKVLV